MDAELDLLSGREDSGDDLLDKLGSGETDGVGERDGFDAGGGKQIAAGDDLIDAPGIAVGVAERPRDISDDSEAGLVGKGAEGLKRIDGFLRALMLIALEEARGDGVGKAE